MKYILLTICITLGYFNVTAQNNRCNCCTEKHAEFDFWLGNWEVRNAIGVVVGVNTINKFQDNCILQENWKSANKKVTGTSTNFYNA